jgi:hypothetical protein
MGFTTKRKALIQRLPVALAIGRTMLIAAAMVIGSLGLSASSARAGGPTTMTGTAVHDPNHPMTPAQQERFAAREAAVQSHATARMASSPDSITSSGYVITGIWEEPQNESGSQNWCGPGSTTAVVSNWNNKPDAYPGGGQAYMTWLARTGVPGIGPMVVGGANPITYDYTLRDTVNNEIGQAFYITKPWVGGTANFASYLYEDLGIYSRPLFTVVQANGLPGWTGYSVAHFQWVTAFDDGADFIEYGDSAGPNATINGQNPYGYHDVSFSDYYYNHLAHPSVWDEIIY